jgi:hypothetical protein
MRRCIIHIGMHKTGSTSIQSSLQGFSDDRFLYANLGNISNHSLAIHSLFAANPGRHRMHKGRNAAAMQAYLTGIRTDLERSIGAAQDRTLILSGEGISGLAPHELVNLRDYFRPRFDELAIVGYARPPAGFMASGFQERIKGGSTKLNLDQAYRDYESRFVKFDEIFGREHVQFWKFDPKAFPGNCVVRDICKRLDISLPVERIVRRNESLSRQAVGLLYIYRKLGHKYGSASMGGPESQHLGDLLAAVGNDKFRFSPDLVRPVLEKNRADIESMEARLGESLHEELGEHRPGDVRDESDLLKVEPEWVKKLLALLGDRAPAGVTGETPEQVAVLIHALRGRRAPGRGAKSRRP